MTYLFPILALLSLLGWTFHARLLRGALRRSYACNDKLRDRLDLHRRRASKRRRALQRIAVYCRDLRDDIDVADVVIAEMRAGGTPRETSASIATWADETFGPVESNMSIWKRADKEFQELRMKIAENDDHPRAAEEAADVCIVLDRLVHRLGRDMMQERERKMVINRARRWNLTGDGHGQHVEEQP